MDPYPSGIDCWTQFHCGLSAGWLNTASGLVGWVLSGFCGVGTGRYEYWWSSLVPWGTGSGVLGAETDIGVLGGGGLVVPGPAGLDLDLLDPTPSTPKPHGPIPY